MFFPINRAGWVASASDFYNDTYAPIKAIDGDPQTAWAQTSPASFAFPHYLEVDMGATPQSYNAISFMRRQDGPEDSPGTIYIYVSTDGVTWTGPIVNTVWSNTPNVIIQPLPAMRTERYIKIVMLDAAAGSRGVVSCAEFNVGISVVLDTGGMTVTCTCLSNPNVSGCFLTNLHLHIDLSFASGGYGMHAFAELLGGPFGVGIGLTSISTSLDLDLGVGAWVDTWGQLNIHFGGEESLFQPPAPGKYAQASGTWYIRQDYVCLQNGTPTQPQFVFAYPTSGGGNACVEGGFVKVVTTAGGGGGTSTLFTSSGLGTCEGNGGGDAFASGFLPTPRPNDNLIDKSNSSGQICLCVTGGVAPYKYSVIGGVLPCGQTLNHDTGCIEGAADGTCPGTDSVTFMVIDSQNHVATVDCGFITPCSGSTGTSGGTFGNAFY